MKTRVSSHGLFPLVLALFSGLSVVSATDASGTQNPDKPRGPVIARSITREDAFCVAAKPEKVFPLLCPVLEYDWIPGWSCELLNSSSGVAELECVFRTERTDSGSQLWVVSRYEPPSCIEFTCFNSGTQHVMRLGIRLEPTPEGGTRLVWRRRWIATGPLGDKTIDEFRDDAHRDMMHNLERLMKRYLGG